MGKEIVSNRISLKDFKGIASVGIGGTGDNTAKEARDNLRIVGRADHNTMNGVAGLDEYGMLKDEQIPEDLFSSGHALNGPKQIVVGSITNVYRVTYWSDFRDIQVTIDNNDATIYLDGNGQVVIDAPSTPGIMMLTITGSYNDEIYCNKSFPIDVVANTDHVNTPSIVSPAAGAFNLGPVVIFTGSSFGVSGGSDTHEGTDWQIATDANFTNIITSVTNSTIDKTTWSVTGLLPATQYYIRTRYKGTSTGYSNWSAVSSLTTKASYILSIEETILTASDKANNALFGKSTSINGDGTRIIIGATQANPGGVSNAGQAYIFVRSGATWTQEAILIASDMATNYYFGSSVAISSDATRCIVGAYASNSSGISAAGQAYVFVRSGTTWTQEAIISASDKEITGFFGISVSITYDGTRCIVGAYTANPSEIGDGGKAYVFTRSGTTWTQEAILIASDVGTGDLFGWSTAISGDGTRCIVGARRADPSGVTDAGKAYIFTRSGTTWIQEAILSGNNKNTGDFFGISVDISGDGTRCIVGSYAADPSGIGDAGKVYIFTRSGTTWTQEAILVASDKAISDSFGWSVSISSDGSRCIIGAYIADVSGITDAGKAYIFTRSGTTWTQEAILITSNKVINDQFGNSVDISGDGTRCIVGAYLNDPSGFSDAGAAYIFS